MNAEVKDLVEVVAKTFDVRFDADEFDDTSTFNDLRDALKRRFDGYKSDSCLTAIAFWRLRRATGELLNMPKKSIRRWSPVESLTTWWRRRTFWRELSRNSGLKLPDLVYSPGIIVIIFLLSCLLALFPVAALDRSGERWSDAAVVAALVVWLVAMVILNSILRPLARQVPSQCLLFGELAQTASGLNYAQLAKETASSRERELTTALCYVIAEAYDAEPQGLKYSLEQEDVTLCELADGLTL